MTVVVLFYLLFNVEDIGNRNKRQRKQNYINYFLVIGKQKQKGFYIDVLYLWD